MKLYNYLKERLCADKMTYIFLDEVQEVPSLRKWLTAFISGIMWMFISQAPMHICFQVSLPRFCQEGTQKSRSNKQIRNEHEFKEVLNNVLFGSKRS